MEIHIDLSQCSLRELLRFGAGQLDMAAIESMLSRVVVGGIDTLNGKQLGEVMRALRDSINETVNPKETA